MNLHPCPIVRADGFDPAEILVAVPYLVGYFPADSLVCLLYDCELRLMVTMRLDWNDAASDPRGVANGVASRAAGDGATQAMLIAVDPAGSAWRRPLSVLSRRLARHGLETWWSGHIDAEHWQSERCQSAGCGTHPLPHPSSSDLVLHLIVAGAAPAPTRDAVLAELAPVAPEERLPECPEPTIDLEVWRDQEVEGVMLLLRDGSPPGDEQIARLGRAMADIRVRDTVLHRITAAAHPDTVGPWDAVWRVVVAAMRTVAPAHVAALGAVAALAAWQLGDGLRAGEALVRARAADPEHGLAKLLQQALDRGAPPSTWEEVMRGLTEAQCRHGRDHGAAA
jgi:hypothetical protein